MPLPFSTPANAHRDNHCPRPRRPPSPIGRPTPRPWPLPACEIFLTVNTSTPRVAAIWVVSCRVETCRVKTRHDMTCRPVACVQLTRQQTQAKAMEAMHQCKSVGRVPGKNKTVALSPQPNASSALGPTQRHPSGSLADLASAYLLPWAPISSACTILFNARKSPPPPPRPMPAPPLPS